MSLTLIIGNKNYSSWSLRPWLFLKYHHIGFDEIRIPLYRDDSKSKILNYSPAGRVPILLDGDIKVWDSLAILEYLAERFPQTQGWPEDAAERALARSLAAEMHAGFAALRTHCGMNCRRPVAAKPLPAAVYPEIPLRQNSCRLKFSAAFKDMMTPYEKLKSLAEAHCYLKPGIIFEQMDAIANECSDNEAARRLNQARAELFQFINQSQRSAG